VLDLVDASETIEVPSVGGRAPRKLFKQELTQIIEPRMTEIMEMIDQELLKSGKRDMLAAGVVLTGGASMLDGCVESAEKVFSMPVRIGVPRDIAGIKDKVATPQYANAVGLLIYGARMSRFRGKARFERSGAGVFSKIKKWLEDYL